AQDESRATYESWCRKEDVGIDWSKPAGEVFNLIRGANPSPGAWTMLGDKTVQIFDSARLDDIAGEPGTVTGISADGIAVAAGSGGILVKRVRCESRDKIPASDLVEQSGLSVGARFGG